MRHRGHAFRGGKCSLPFNHLVSALSGSIGTVLAPVAEGRALGRPLAGGLDMSRTRARLAILLVAALSAGGWAIGAARAESTLRIGMTAADIPQTTGIPDQGGEGYRFIGYQLYDALVNWNLSRSDVVANLTPGLATAWHPDPADPKKWIFKLRQGVEFHDGSPFNADAVIWNLDKILKEDAPQYDRHQVAQVMSRIPSFASYRKIDDFTVEITTKFANSLLPYETTGVLFQPGAV